MPRIPVVKVKTEDGYKIINESDFDEEKHEKYVEPKKKKEPEKDADESYSKEQTSPGWFVVTNSKGEPQHEKKLREEEADALIEKLSE